MSTALCKEREERYQSAHELLEGLKSLRREMEFKASWTLHCGSFMAALDAIARHSGARNVNRLLWHWPFRSTGIETCRGVQSPEKSIAVLPFENLSDDKDNAYFAAGIQDELLTSLSKIADLKVISRTSTQRISGQTSQSWRDREATWRSEHS